ncbi:lysylphosphatidylglycerol synthase domain-containing protein [Euzebya rosea]|uniref:lysylphosphatidylglycerol synthase domain-containing protein n=1 Tax=Euzebya rosea TaxID=2052804 RepID=UPI000D3EC1E0|nr:lysylphosphatidylglycerol synthase domain-containing protein [Euzebya rosea]
MTDVRAGQASSRALLTRWVVASALVALVGSLVGLGARATYGARTSGDEPYYLLTALGLAQDGSLDIADEIEEGAFRPFHEIALDEQTTPLDAAGRRVSPHDPLLGVLLAPAMALPPSAAWPAAKATLAVLAALLAGLTTWVAVQRFDVRPAVAGIVVGGLSAAMPLASYGTQVYPEVPAALAVMAAVALLTAPRVGPLHLLGFVTAVVALPWLAVKYAPVAAVVALLAGIRWWRAGHRRTVVIATAVFGVAGVAYLGLHHLWFGGWTVYAAGDHFVSSGELSVVGNAPNPLGRARRLVGLLVDADFGIAAWTPAWFALPAAIAVVLRQRTSDRWVLLAPAAAGWLTATFVALTMHGWWSPGRQVVVVLPLLVIVLARAADAMVSSRAAMAGGLAALLAGVVGWVWLAVEASTGGPVLIVDFADSASPIRRLLVGLLPDGRRAGIADDVLLAVWAVALLASAMLAWRRVGHADVVPATREAVDVRRLARAGVVAVGSVLVVAVTVWGVRTVDTAALRTAWDTLSASPARLLVGVGAFGLAFVLRAVAWQRVLPRLGFGQALAGIHLALGGNHVLPLRLGEPLRIVSVVRRAGIEAGAATASTVLLRSGDVLVLLVLGLLAGPAVVTRLLGPVGGIAAGVVAALGVAAWLVIARRPSPTRVADTASPLPTGGELPGLSVIALTAAAWLLEAVLVHEVASVFGVQLTAAESVVVLAAAIAGQLVAVAPGGLGSYEAAATAGLAAAGVPVATGLAIAIGLHAVKTAYSLAVGAIALGVPAPGLVGNLRLPRRAIPRPAPAAPADLDAPVVLFMPAHNEGPRVADVVRRAPATVHGHPVVVAVIDDGSTDDTVAEATAAGAVVVPHPTNLGLGAAVRTGLEWSVEQGAAAVAFCDADGEYDPAELGSLVGPILDGDADYVGGSRFAGQIEWMRPHRRAGNLVLTAWVRWTVRQPVSDGQTGYRAFSPAAAADARIPHDYNYAQVLTIDLVGRGYRYAEVPITYRFRESGRSFVRLGRYLRRVVPTVWRQLNPPPLADTRPAT